MTIEYITRDAPKKEPSKPLSSVNQLIREGDYRHTQGTNTSPGFSKRTTLAEYRARIDSFFGPDFYRGLK